MRTIIIAIFILVSSAHAQTYLCQFKYQGYKTKDGEWGFGMAKEVNYVMKMTDSTIAIGDSIKFKIDELVSTEDNKETMCIKYLIIDNKNVPAYVEFIKFKESKRTAILVSYLDDRYVLTVSELLK